MLSLDQIHLFITVVETGSFSACARKLGKAQSAISQGIANLELDLNVTLFDRSTRIPSLTSDGKRLLPQARAILMQAAEFESAVVAVNKAEEPLVRVAVDSALSYPRLWSILKRFSDTFPNTELELLECASPDIHQLLQNERLDIGLVFSDVALKSALKIYLIGYVPFVAVCDPQHPLALASDLDLSDLLLHREVVMRSQSQQVLQLLPPMSPKTWWADSFYQMRELIAAGVGWGYLPQPIAAEGLGNNELHTIDLALDYKTWAAPADLVVTKSRTSGPAMQWLVAELKNLLDPLV